MPSKTTRSLLLTLTLVTVTSILASTAFADGWLSRRNKDRVIEGSGVLETQVLDLADFDSIRVDAVANVYITIGDEFHVELEAEDNILELVDAHVRRGQLRIDMDDDYDIDTDEDITFTITMPSLIEVEANGVYEIFAEGLNNRETVVSANGVGTVELTGTTERLEVTADGVGNVELRDLVAQVADVHVGGVGDVVVYVEQDLQARVNGLGSIKYYGDPVRIDDRVDGFGSIRSGR